jgi:iron complex transport system substrate-binding protein
LVGRSHECDFPEAVRRQPACTAAKIAGGAGGAEIDRQVKELARENVSLYRLDDARLRELQPDLILTQAQCDVCAVSLAEVEQAVSRWPGNHPQILALAPSRLAEIWEDMQRVANALELAGHGKEVIRELKGRVVAIIEKTCVLKDTPAVACIEWIEPLMAAGNWVPELVELAGGRNLVGEPGKHSPWLDWEVLRKLDPEIIVAMPCGFDLKRTRAEMAALAQLPGWDSLRAVKKRRVFLADGSRFFNRPGPRIVESLEILAEICHPDRFNFGHRGVGWEKP